MQNTENDLYYIGPKNLDVITVIATGRGGRVVYGAISNSSRENALGPRFESRLGAS